MNAKRMNAERIDRTKRRGLWLLLLVWFSPAALYAQQPDSLGTMAGVLIDSATRQPLPFATVALSEHRRIGQPNNPTDGTLTDSLGRFAYKHLRYGAYFLTGSAVGYRPLHSRVWTLDAEHPTQDVGVLALAQDARTLQTVTVRGQKPLIEQRVDGITFNVEGLPGIAGNTAAEVLRRVPMLSVDASGGLSMRGSSRIRVFIDGKPSDFYASSVADALRSIPGETIVNVAVITHPSARYEAENTDGVVLITTRRLRANATNGEVSGIAGNRSESLMGNVQRKSGQWLLKADAYYQTYWNRNGSVLEREAGWQRITQRNESRQTGDNLFGGATALYSLDSLNTLTVGYRLRWLPNQTHTISDNATGVQETLTPSFQRQINSAAGGGGSTFLAGYTGTSRNKRKEFSLLSLYGLLTGLTHYDLAQSGSGLRTYGEDFAGNTQSRDLVVQADYTQTSPNSWKWEAGGKLIRRDEESNNRFRIDTEGNQRFRPDLLRSNTFTYRRTISALYTSLSFQVKTLQFVTGLRYEHTALKAAFRNNPLPIPSLANWVPNLLVSHKLSKKSTLKASYTLRLIRPNFSALNPTVNNSDSLNVLTGNPYLRPEITRRYQLNYARNDTRLFTDVVFFYNDNRNSIESIRRARPDVVFETTWQNIGRNQRLGTSVTLNWKPTSELSLGTTLTTQYVWLASPALNLTNQGLQRLLTVTASYKFTKGYSLDIYGYVDGDNVRLQGYRSGWQFYSVTVSKKSKDERFSLSLRADTFLTPHQFIDEVTWTDAFRQDQTHRYQNQNIRLTASYKLGKKEIKGPRVRQADNPE